MYEGYPTQDLTFSGHLLIVPQYNIILQTFKEFILFYYLQSHLVALEVQRFHLLLKDLVSMQVQFNIL